MLYGHADASFAFAHNGVLYNDKELRAEKHLPKTKIETDSYVAVQLIEQHGKLNFGTLKNDVGYSSFEQSSMPRRLRKTMHFHRCISR